MRSHALSVANTDATLAKFSDVRDHVLGLLRSDVGTVAPKDMQRTASGMLEKKRFDDRMADLERLKDLRALAHAAATTAKYSHLWLYSSIFASAPKLWFDDAVFVIAVRLRLAIPLEERASLCVFCQATQADVMGDHALTCMHGGNKTRVHTLLVDQLVHIASKAGALPQREVHPFAGADEHYRMDVVVRLPGSRNIAELCDVAVTHPCAACHVSKPYSRHPAGENGAADAYEKVKTDKYGAALARLPDARLKPMVFDSFGGVSSTCAETLKALSKLWAQRIGIAVSTAVRNVMHRFNVEVVRGVARVAGTSALAGAVRP
jgi:hypothetical protein